MGFRRVTHVAWRKVGEETVLVDLRTNRIFGLNEAGGALWACLDESGVAWSSLESEHSQMAQAFLAQLAAEGLVDEVTLPQVPAPAEEVPPVVPSSPPAIAWQESLETFAAAGCSLQPGSSLACDQNPYSS
jgi:hypothetical protein